jgi:hypothetical protein
MPCAVPVSAWTSCHGRPCTPSRCPQRRIAVDHCSTRTTLQVINVGVPHDEFDARHCGFSSLGASLRAISVAVLEFPDDAEIHIGQRVRGERPINLIPDIVQAAFAIHETAKPRRGERYSGDDSGREYRTLRVIDGFKISGGSVDQLMRFYRDEFDHPHDFGFRVLEKALLSPAPVTN